MSAEASGAVARENNDAFAVSVGMATHSADALADVEAAARSVVEQSVPVERLVIAVDHNPDHADRVRRALPDALVVENTGRHRGASATRNAGAAACDTPVIAFLDDDEVAEPDWLANLLPPLREPNIVGTGGRYVPRWLAGRPSWFPDELAWAVGAHHSGMPDESAPVRNVWSGNMAVRTEVFRAVGGFREGFGKTGTRLSPEDTDLCIRMAAARTFGTWIYRPDARITHAVPGHRSTFAFFVRRCFAEGRGKVFLKDLSVDDDVLDTERDYLRRTIPRGISGHLRHAVTAGHPRAAMSAVLRALAIMVGVVAAGAGAGVSTVEGSLRRRKG